MNSYILFDDLTNLEIGCFCSEREAFYKMYQLVKNRFISEYGWKPWFPSDEEFYDNFKKYGYFNNGISKYSVRK